MLLFDFRQDADKVKDALTRWLPEYLLQEHSIPSLVSASNVTYKDILIQLIFPHRNVKINLLEGYLGLKDYISSKLLIPDLFA